MRECRECFVLVIQKIKTIWKSIEFNDTQKIGLLIFLTIIFTYLPLAIANFGYFDDYFWLNKIILKTKYVLDVCVQGGRILSGFIEQYLFSLFNSIYKLKYIRLISIVLIAFSSVIFYKFLVKAGFRKKSSAIFSLLTAFTPSMQIYASWAVLSSAPLSIMLSTVAAFSFIKFKNFKLFILRSILIWLSLLIYQPSAMIYFALIPVIIYSQLMNNKENLHIAKATICYVFSGILGCVLAYLTLRLVPTIFGIPVLKRAALATKFYPKLIWFIQFPLIHSTNLLMLQNRYITPVAFILLFIVLIFISKKARNPLFISSYLYSVPLSYLPNLVVTENWDSNRTLIGLYVIWCGILFLVIENFEKKFKFNTAILVMFILALSYYVQKNIMDEFIVPGTMEVSYAVHEIRKINPATNSTVCIIPSHWYELARYGSSGDFGLSAFYSSWSATAIFRDVFHQMHKNKTVFFTVVKDNKEKSKCTYFIDTSQVSSFRTYGKLYVVW